jgi:hypothetical protein
VDAVVVGAEDVLSGVGTAEGELSGVEVVLAVNELVTSGVEVGVEDALRRANSSSRSSLCFIALLELKDG